MKIIAVDNYKRKNVADVLVAENVHPHYGEFIVESLMLNHSLFFKLVDDDYKLWRGMDELV